MRAEKASSGFKVPGSGSRFAIRGSVSTRQGSRHRSGFKHLGPLPTYSDKPRTLPAIFLPSRCVQKKRAPGSRFPVRGSRFAVRGSARGKIVGTDPDSSISAATYLLRKTPNPASHFSALPVRAEKGRASKARPSPGITWPGPGDVRSLIDRAPGNPGSRSVSGLPSH